MSGENVLVVEDERVVALDIKTQLERFGYIVPATFARAEDALAYLASEPPDLVLMDIHLAGKLDGITAAGRIRRDYHLPVILLTAYSDEATIERARASKPYAYLIKPFNAKELRTSIVIALERHALENQVRERQMILDTVVENVGEGILLCDRDETVRYANGIAASMLGVEQRELENEPLGAVVRFEEGVGIEEAISSRGYATLCSRRGEGVPVDIRMAEVPGGDRVYVLQDAREYIDHERELLQKEEQLSHARKMEAIGRLAGGIAHEFNNLLTVIMGYARLVADAAGEDEDPEWIRRNAEGILNAAAGSTGMVRQLLSFGRYEEHKPQRLSLNTTVGNLDRVLTRLMGENIAVHLAMEEDLPPVMVDPGRIEQSLMNLVINARDAMSSGGVLSISTRSVSLESPHTVVSGELAPGWYVTLSVADTGKGIERTTLSRIFEPFFTTKDRGEGTGLGLAAVYSTVEQAGGFLDVESRPEKGTVFTIYLPATDGGETTDALDEGRTHRDTAALSGTGRVLMVIPDQNIRKMLAQLFSGYGYIVYESSNPGEALILVEELGESFDVTICDFAMPLISGIRFLKRVERAAPGKPSVLLLDPADHLEEQDFDQLREARALRKPFSPERILEIVREAMVE